MIMSWILLLTVALDFADAIGYVTKTTYQSNCSGGITSKSLWGVLDVCVQDGRNSYHKSTCGSTHLVKTAYLDGECKILAPPSQSWNVTKECDSTDDPPTSYDCGGTGLPAVSTEYTTPGCSDNSFDGVKYMIQDVCHKWSTSSSEWYKRRCRDGKLEQKFFSDSDCIVAATTAPIAFELDECQQAEMAGETKYLKLYKGCGQTGTLPSGVVDPDMGDSGPALVSLTRRAQDGLDFMVGMAVLVMLNACC
jgi:hypothetical protein